MFTLTLFIVSCFLCFRNKFSYQLHFYCNELSPILSFEMLSKNNHNHCQFLLSTSSFLFYSDANLKEPVISYSPTYFVFKKKKSLRSFWKIIIRILLYTGFWWLYLTLRPYQIDWIRIRKIFIQEAVESIRIIAQVWVSYN